MGTKSPSDMSASAGWVEEVPSGPQLRSHGPVSSEQCATPSTSAGGATSPSRPRAKPKKKTHPEPSTSACRQLFVDNVEEAESAGEAGPSGAAATVGGRTRHLCSQCPKSFGSPGKLSQHLYSHTGERPFACQQCGKAFSSRFKLVRHALIHSDQRQYRCQVCDRTFHRKDHLKNHSKVHSPVKRRYKCERAGCGKEYSSPVSFRKHVAIHAAEDGNLECTICNKTYSTKEEIVLHLKIHAGSRSVKTQADRKYRCDHCDRSFFTGKDVRRHLVVHTGKRDFQCLYCPQKFGRKDHLVRHVRKSHNNAGKKGKKKLELRTRTVTSILEEASTSHHMVQQTEELKSDSRSSFRIFSDHHPDLPSTSGGIFKQECKDLSVHFSQAEDLLSETSGSMMSEIYQSPPPPYPLSPLSTMTFDPGTSTEELEIKPEVINDLITLLPHQFHGTLPPNMLLTTATLDPSEPTSQLGMLPADEYILPADDDESSLHRQFLQMSNLIPQTSQAPSPDTDLIFLSTDAPTSSTPLPRFNQAFHQSPP